MAHTNDEAQDQTKRKKERKKKTTILVSSLSTHPSLEKLVPLSIYLHPSGSSFWVIIIR